MKRGAFLALVVLLAGCSAPDAPEGDAPTPATGSLTTPPTMTSTTTPTTPGDAPPVDVKAAPAPASGPPVRGLLWEEPAPPRADLVLARVTGAWSVRVEGAPGAVPPGAHVLVADGGTARGALVRAGADGAFRADVLSAPGGQLQVATVPPQVAQEVARGRPLHEALHQVIHAQPSTYVRVPSTAPVAQTGHVVFGSPWAFEGRVDAGGADVRVVGTLRIHDARSGDVPVVVRLLPLFDAEGDPLAGFAYATSRRTPSGLALEATTREGDGLAVATACQATAGACAVDVQVPFADAPTGGFVVMLAVALPGDPAYEMDPPRDYVKTSPRAFDQADGSPLAFVRRGGTDPTLGTLLLVDTPTQAARGVEPDGASWGWANRIAFQPPLHVTPRTDAGEPIAYTLEPYLPHVGVTDRDGVAPFLLDLDPAASTWTVRVRAPDGTVTTLGPHAFDEVVTRTATTHEGELLNNGGGNVNGVPRLARLDDAFRHAFATDGEHVIEAEGVARDRAGNAFRIGGTYRVLVAEPMDLDLGMLPGTPLAAGDYVDRAIQVHPPVPAEIAYRFRAWTGPDATLTLDSWTRGNASAFGWFHPHAGHPVRPMEAGEYRVDVFANHTTTDGRRMAAAWSFGGVIVDAAGDPLETRGRKGIDQDAQDLARFHRSETGIPVGGNHFNFPYHPGDVSWQTDDDSMEVRITLDEPSLEAALLRALPDPLRFEPPLPGGPVNAGGATALRARVAQGQTPLLSGGTLEAYAYATVERPGVRVRELVKEDYVPNGYWRFDETYTLQPGVGPAGDLPQDYKLLLGGAVVRDGAAGLLRTGGYASLWIDVAKDDPRGSRTLDPFAPDAGPLLPGVAAFYEPTGLRAGSLLVVGDVADFGGYVAPLGPHVVRIEVESPSGKTRAFEGRANPWGHLHDPAMNFVVDEPGVWRATVAVEACKAGACLRGGLNDARTSFGFYVASADAPPLPLAPPAWLTPGGALALDVEGVSDGHATAWMPGWLIEARAVGDEDPLVRYRWRDVSLPNFDKEGHARGLPAEQVTFTALAKAPDGSWRGAALDVWGPRVMRA